MSFRTFFFFFFFGNSVKPPSPRLSGRVAVDDSPNAMEPPAHGSGRFLMNRL
jgi:hypothetical protein